MGGICFSVLDLLELDLKEHDSLKLKCLAGRDGLNRKISTPDINRPGLALSGFFEDFAHERIQLFGRGECAYLKSCRKPDTGLEHLEKMFKKKPPCCIFSHNLMPEKDFLDIACKYGCPVLQSQLNSSDFTLRILRVLSNIFAAKDSVHGVLVDVFGTGILITGDSGVGKSEAALELVERGHRLIADDLVEISCLNGNTLIGKGHKNTAGHHMEIRGLGVIDIRQLYGIGAVREAAQIQMVAKLEEWNPERVYDSLGDTVLTATILNVRIPLLEIPVKSGRNIPIIIETAAKNERLKSMGYFSARDLNWIESSIQTGGYYNDGDTY